MSVQTLVGDFVQVGPDGRRAEGKIYLQKPGRVRFEYNPPSPIELVADGNSLVVRDRKLETQDLYPLSQTPLRFLLADRIDLLRETNVVAVSADDTFVSLVIEEKQTLGGTHKVLLMFSAKDMQLKQWTITDPQGYDTTVALYNLDPAKKLDPAMFRDQLRAQRDHPVAAVPHSGPCRLRAFLTKPLMLLASAAFTRRVRERHHDIRMCVASPRSALRWRCRAALRRKGWPNRPIRMDRALHAGRLHRPDGAPRRAEGRRRARRSPSSSRTSRAPTPSSAPTSSPRPRPTATRSAP